MLKTSTLHLHDLQGLHAAAGLHCSSEDRESKCTANNLSENPLPRLRGRGQGEGGPGIWINSNNQTAKLQPPEDSDTDNDGLPNLWEARPELNQNLATINFWEIHAGPDGDGNTYIKKYLHWMTTLGNEVPE